MKLRFLFLVLLNLVYVYTLQASHVLGGHITYEHISADLYKVQLLIYTDCSSAINPPMNPSVNIESNSCNQSLTLGLNMENPIGVVVTDLCSNEVANNLCNGGAGPNRRTYIYTNTITLTNCNDWDFSYRICCRYALTNLIDADSYSLFLYASLDNSIAPNSSPIFKEPPFWTFGSGQFNYNVGAVESNGDSLVYSFIAPRDDLTTNIVFANGLSTTQPFFTTPANTCTINEQTGQVSFVSTGNQSGALSILIKEYRNGIEVGSVLHEHPIIMFNPTLNQDLQISSPSNLSQGVSQNGYRIEAPLGTSINFDITVSSLDTNTAPIITPNLHNMPNATITETGVHPKTIMFNWAPTTVGKYPFTIRYSDDVCPIAHVQVLYYEIVVTNPGSTTNIQPELIDNTIQIYPNPSDEHLYIESPNAIDNVALYDILGRPVFTKNISTQAKQLSINVQEFMIGTYIIQIKTSEGYHNRKVVIQ